MSQLQTNVSIPRPDFEISYQSRVTFLGSCFADAIGLRMQNLKFETCVNPFGVLYNPHSVSQNLMALCIKKEFIEDDLLQNGELWYSFSHYTLFSDVDKQRCLARINREFSKARTYITNSQALFITLGTSWYYRYKKNGQVVANCHKLPANEFDRTFADPEQSAEVLYQAIQQLREVNPSLQVVFTVSPIRHWKDGAIGNQRSKAALHMAIRELESTLETVYYFPSYEIFMDELRDYRFYASDMLHPSEQAQEIIWERFAETFCSADDISLMQKIQQIRNAVNHRPRFTESKAYQHFIQSTQRKIKNLERAYPFLNFNEELEKLQFV